MLPLNFAVVKTSKEADDSVGTRKTFAVPTLMYSLPSGTQQTLTGFAARSESEKGMEEKVKIRLMPKQGWRVSGHVCVSPTMLSYSRVRPPSG